MLFFKIVLGLFATAAIFFLAFGEFKRKKRDMPEWAYVGRVIAGTLAIVIVTCGVMLLAMPPAENAGDQQLVTEYMTADEQTTFNGLPQTGRIQQRTATGEIVKDIYIYGTYSDVTVRSETVTIRVWPAFVFIALLIAIVVWAALWHSRSKHADMREKYFRHGKYQPSAEGTYYIAHICMAVILVILMFVGPFQQKFPTEQIHIDSLSTVMVDADAQTVTFVSGNTERIYHGTDELSQAFRTVDGPNRQYAINYDTRTDTLVGVIEVIEY